VGLDRGRSIPENRNCQLDGPVCSVGGEDYTCLVNAFESHEEIKESSVSGGWVEQITSISGDRERLRKTEGAKWARLGTDNEIFDNEFREAARVDEFNTYDVRCCGC